MAKRKAYAPFSLTSEAGVAQTPVEGYIDVEQKIYPIGSKGTINENGKWAGVISDDTEFFGFTKAENVTNGGEFLCPDTSRVPSLDMTGFRDLFIAFRPTEGGGSGYNILAVMGPDTERFANLQPVLQCFADIPQPNAGILLGLDNVPIFFSISLTFIFILLKTFFNKLF